MSQQTKIIGVYYNDRLSFSFYLEEMMKKVGKNLFLINLLYQIIIEIKIDSE
jgi:hypothetical protein